VCPEVEPFNTCSWRKSIRYTNRWGRHIYVNLCKLLIAPGSPVISMNGTDVHAESMKYTEQHKHMNVIQWKTVPKIGPPEIMPTTNLLKQLCRSE
jgi:hypothetical protein